mmetsp:Transcript_41167/g.108758  ORF Transcript_41167/g.108758 Transcript_41167/m.108758 type:complete len:221 (+) Transcript_41167:781-1443(+)
MAVALAMVAVGAVKATGLVMAQLVTFFIINPRRQAAVRAARVGRRAVAAIPVARRVEACLVAVAVSCPRVWAASRTDRLRMALLEEAAVPVVPQAARRVACHVAHRIPQPSLIAARRTGPRDRVSTDSCRGRVRRFRIKARVVWVDGKLEVAVLEAGDGEVERTARGVSQWHRQACGRGCAHAEVWRRARQCQLLDSNRVLDPSGLLARGRAMTEGHEEV